jgi:Tol biopolymer transport system component
VVSPDGRYLLFQRDTVGNGEVWYRGLTGDTTRHHIEATQAGQVGAYGGRFSPDGKYIVYAWSLTGTPQVVVRSFPELGPPRPVSVSGGTTPVWSADGKRIYFVNNGQLIVATLGSTSPLSVASRSVVLSREYSFNEVHADYDVARDGRTIVALRSPSQASQLVVVRNLATELHARRGK